MDGNNTSSVISTIQNYTLLYPEARISFTIVLAIANVITIFANSMVLLTVYGNPRLRTNTNFFITNLSFVDLVCGLVLMPLVLHSMTGDEKRSVMICNLLGFIDAAYSTASSLTIALIALDRYHSIVNCLHYENIVTRRRTVMGIAGIWILTLFTAICPIFGWGKYQYDQPQYKCSLLLPDKHGFLWFMFCTSIMFPYIIIIFCYTQIHLVARRHAKNMIAIHVHDTGQRIKAVSTAKTKLVYLVVGIFTVCWLPIFTIKLFQNVATQFTVPAVVVTTATILSLINGSCNPFLYALITSQYRVGMTRVYRRVRRKFGQPVAIPSGDQSKSSWSVSKPISNLYRYFQENDAGNLRACVGKTTTEDFKKEQRGLKPSSEHPTKLRHTLQIPTGVQ